MTGLWSSHSLLDGLMDAAGHFIILHGGVGALLESLCCLIAVHFVK